MPVSVTRITIGWVIPRGGAVPIEGGFDTFNAIEIHQADVRVADSLLQFNAPGVHFGFGVGPSW